MKKTILTGLFMTATCCVAAPEIVWQIGTPDHSYAEFAIAGNYGAFMQWFAAHPMMFAPGKSRSGQDWPFIHPGPIDAWAGHRVYPFRIRFPLADAPRGTFTLRIDLMDVHANFPPALVVTVGGRSGRFVLRPGAGDASLTDAGRGRPQRVEATLPAAYFHKGTNEITLAAVDGSWLLYDAISLFQDPDMQAPRPVIRDLGVRPTMLYVWRNGRLRRVLEATATCNAPPRELTWRIQGGGKDSKTVSYDLPLFGSIIQELTVPALETPFEVRVTAATGASSKTVTAQVRPARQWKVFVAPSAHTDIGYTHIQAECAERHNHNLDTAIDLATKYPDFKWNCEVAWIAENYLRDRKPEARRRFLELARQGRIGVQALYANMLTGLCSPEELCRLTGFAHRLHWEYGIPFESAMLSDVPTSVWAMPMMLRQAGIRYFAQGSNNTRAVTFTDLFGRSPCWWEGPDGSRVLMLSCPGYAHASGWGLTTGMEKARRRVVDNLRRYEERKDYPYDAVFLYGAVSDNSLLPPALASVCAEWNKRYAYPQLILCRNAEFFQYIEKKYGDRLPVVRGSGGTYWEDGAASSARETALCRHAHETLATAEKLYAFLHRLAPSVSVPRTDLENAWRNCLLYDEHTWGAHCSVSQPESDFTKAQWKIKARFAREADRASRKLLASALRSLSAQVQTQTPAILVFNPLNWSRTDIVEADIPPHLQVVDADGEPAPACRIDGKVLFLARDVPACGYSTYRLRAGSVPAAVESIGSLKLENRFYRLEINPETGAVVGLLDKQRHRDLVDRSATYGVNQYLYVTGGKGTRIETGNGAPPDLKVSTTENAEVRSLQLGDLGRRIIVESNAVNTLRLVSEITLWDDVKRIDFVNRVTKKLTYGKESVYFAFPFAAEKPVVRYEAPLAITRPDRDLLAGACRDWFTIQHYVEVTSADDAVVWATPDAPLACFGKINTGEWKRHLNLVNGHVYGYVMNNYWFTNYLAGQGGDFVFRFAVTSRPGADAAPVKASTRFGWEVSNAMTAIRLVPNPVGNLSTDLATFVEVAEPDVLLIGAKTADDANALILRLWNPSRTPVTAHIRLPLFPAKKATLCTVVEDPLRPLEVHAGVVTAPVSARGIATVRLE